MFYPLSPIYKTHISIKTALVSSTDIEYQFTETDYIIAEDTTVPVCVMIISGDVIFTPGGFLTLRFLTSPITATCQFNHYK